MQSLTYESKIKLRERQRTFKTLANQYYFHIIHAIAGSVILILIIMCANLFKANFALTRENAANETYASQLEQQLAVVTEKMQDGRVAAMRSEIARQELVLQIEKIQLTNAALNQRVEQKDKSISQITTEMDTLKAEYGKVYDEYTKLSAREELYDKYEYAVIYRDARTDLTYEQIALVESLMEDLDLNPIIMFAQFGVESEFTATARNPENNAIGFGQFLESTGEWVYHDLMKEDGEYIQSVTPKDGTTNILMYYNYMKFLQKESHNDLFTMIKTYRGRTGTILSQYIDGMSAVCGINIWNMM